MYATPNSCFVTTVAIYLADDKSDLAFADAAGPVAAPSIDSIRVRHAFGTHSRCPQ